MTDNDQPDWLSRRPHLLVAALTAVLLLGLFGRLHDLGELPTGLWCDEAANGLDAYYLLAHGRASFTGERLPLFFNHHGKDWVEGLYTYATVPAIAIWGRTPFAARVVAAVFGSLLILTTFLLARRLFDTRVGLLAAVFIAVSPWAFALSRVGFRAILMPVFLTLGVYCFDRWRDNRWWLVAAALCFGLSFHSYSAAKALTPLTMLLLCLADHEQWRTAWRERRRQWPAVLVAGLLLAVIAAPVHWFTFLGPGNDRFRELSVLAGEAPLRRFLGNYLAHLGWSFLFANGDPNARHGVPDYGQLLLVLLPGIALGLVAALRERRRPWLLVMALFLLGILPAALTNQGIPHALRGIGALPYLQVLAAAGFVWGLDRLPARRRWPRPAVAAGLALLIALNAGHFLRAYFGRYRLESSRWFAAGFGDAVRLAEDHFSPDAFRILYVTAKVTEPVTLTLFHARDATQPADEVYAVAYRMSPADARSTWPEFAPDDECELVVIILHAGRSLESIGIRTPAEVPPGADILGKCRGPDNLGVGFVVCDHARMESPGE